VKNAQKKMQEFLNALVRDGKERGVQLAAYLDGKLVVDAWAGVADPATGRPVDGDTLFPVFSTTKGIAATLAHLLVERGKISYDTPLAEVWPGFGAHGKGGITLRHALGHSAGLPYMPMDIGYQELANWDTMCELLAKERPVWPAGEQALYHAVTYGWLVGEPLRRVDGRPFQQMLRDEICRPLGLLNDLFVGIPDEVEPRVAVLEEIFESGKEPVVDDSKPQSVPGFMQPLYRMMNHPIARRTCNPASNGIMTARAIARHYAALLPGGVDGVELLPTERILAAVQRQLPKRLPENGELPNFALGYRLEGPQDPAGRRLPTFGHGGYGGSTGIADLENRLAVGFTKNLFSKNDARESVLRELRSVLGIS